MCPSGVDCDEADLFAVRAGEQCGAVASMLAFRSWPMDAWPPS